MNHWFSLLNIAGSAVLAAFGLYVWRVEPRNHRNQAFALFAVGFSLATALDNIVQMLDLQGPLLSASWALQGIVYGLGGIGAAWFGTATVEPDRRTALKWLVVPGVLALAATGVGALVLTPEVPLAARVLVTMGFFSGLVGGSLFAVLLLADDFRHPDRSPARRREWAFLAAALVLYPSFYLTANGADSVTNLIDPSRGFPLVFAVLAAVFFGTALLVVVAWIRASRVSEGSAAARNVAILAAGIGLVGLAVSVTQEPGRDLGVPFLARTGAVAILGYGILRHQLLGIDEKVQFGVSKTTVAGIFVAVFFVVSEGAQALFADFAGNELLGVLAAGLLVFFLAPIQRAADGLAESVVPGGAAAPAGASEAEARYRAMVEGALADGEITRDEEHRLAEKAENLGIPHTRALELREKVEGEADGGDPS